MSTKKKTKASLLRRSGFVIFLLVILGAIALIRITITHREIQDIADIDLPLIEVLTKIETNQLEQSILLERAIRYAQEKETVKLARVNFVISDSLFRDLAKRVDRDLLIADKQVTDAIETTDERAHLRTLKNLHLSLRKLEREHTDYENHALNVLLLLEQGDLENAILISYQVEKEEDAFNKRIEEALVRHEMFTETIVKVVEEDEILSRDTIVILTLAFVIVAIILAYAYSFRIWKPLEDIRVGAVKLGEGQLDTRVQLRGSTMTEDIVHSFNAMAERLQKAQKEIDNFVQFSYRTSHDLKAPLANVKSLLKMLDKDMIEANFNAVVNNATKSVEQLEDTVKALTKVNQLREDMKSEEEKLSFEEIAGGVITSLTTQVEEAGASIRMDFKECPVILYPKAHLQSIFQNLLTNSLKYRDPQKPLIVELQTATKNGQAFLTVKDNGLGFDSVKYHDNTFKPFQRFHSHETGSGLGLYILKTIIDFHKGSIKVKSLPQKGAHFSLRLN